MPRVKLSSDLDDLRLFCPFCGEQAVSGADEEYPEPCEHVVCCGIDDPGEKDIKETDLVFECFEPAPASRTHLFAFRES